MNTGKITPKKPKTTTSYTLIKENKNGSVKKKDISENKFNRVQNRFNKLGGTNNVLSPNVQISSNKNDKKRVIKTTKVELPKNKYLR